ncbi:hypothetical protein GINT2_002193 [Glugoides intestinalis]
MTKQSSNNISKLTEGVRLPNPVFKDPVERSWCTQDPQIMVPTHIKVGRLMTPNQRAFRRGMTEKEVKIELFMLEDDPTFMNMREKEKMQRLMSSASQDLKACY